MIVGVFLFGVAGTALASSCVRRRLTARIALMCYWTGVPLAIAAFVGWLGLVVQLGAAPSSTELAIAEIFGWWVSRADWIATVLLVGLGPLLISIAGRDDWVPTWLVGVGVLAGIAGGITIVAMLTGGLATFGQVSIPVGLGWSLAAGVVLIRESRGERLAADSD